MSIVHRNTDTIQSEGFEEFSVCFREEVFQILGKVNDLSVRAETFVAGICYLIKEELGLGLSKYLRECFTNLIFTARKT